MKMTITNTMKQLESPELWEHRALTSHKKVDKLGIPLIYEYIDGMGQAYHFRHIHRQKV